MNLQVLATALLWVIAALVVVLIVFRAAEARIAALKSRLRVAAKKEEGRLVENEVYLRIRGGRAKIVKELPVRVVREEIGPQETFYPEIQAISEIAATEAGPAEKGELDGADQRIIKLSANVTGGIDEKYAALDARKKRYFDEFVEYVSAMDGVKRIKNKGNVVFRCNSQKMLDLVVRRGVPVVRFELVNAQLKRAMEDDELKDVKVSTVNVKLLSASDVDAAKQTADITYRENREERAYRMEQRKIQRAKKRREQAARKKADAALPSAQE